MSAHACVCVCSSVYASMCAYVYMHIYMYVCNIIIDVGIITYMQYHVYINYIYIYM